MVWALLIAVKVSIINHFVFFQQGLHPRLVTEGFEQAKAKAMEVLEKIKVSKDMDRDTLINVARTSLRTKVHNDLADLLTEVSICISLCF